MGLWRALAIVATLAVIAAGCDRAAAPSTADLAPTPATVATRVVPLSPTSVPPTPTRVPPTSTPTRVPPTPTRIPTQVPTAVPTVAPEFVTSPGAVPLTISIPRLHSDAPIVPLDRQDDGMTLDVPSDPDTIGWYDFTAQVGRPGNAVLVGHVDWGGRLRAFGRLRDLHEGDEIDVLDALARHLTYRVQSTALVDADASPAEFLTQRGPEPELTLITCGGLFDRTSHQYLSRVIVRAAEDG